MVSEVWGALKLKEAILCPFLQQEWTLPCMKKRQSLFITIFKGFFKILLDNRGFSTYLFTLMHIYIYHLGYCLFTFIIYFLFVYFSILIVLFWRVFCVICVLCSLWKECTTKPKRIYYFHSITNTSMMEE